jgi:betaine-aldehyde dehydrogenase
MRAASDTVKPVMLELGGKNALIAYPTPIRTRSRRR